MNCFALEQDGRILVVDSGAAFPDDDLGVDLVVPDFSWLLAQEEAIEAVFITHGHEDHIGALPHLVRTLERPIDIYAPPHACALIAERFSEQDLSNENLHCVRPGTRYSLGPFEVEPVHVAHSIIDATALAIRTAAGLIIHTADFDLDEEQPAGRPTDEQRLRELGEEGVRLLLSDSTNIDSEKREASEGDVARELLRVVEEAKHRVIVGMFSSNAHRLRALGEAAQKTGRKLCFLGRSLMRHYRIAEDLGVLGFPSDLVVSPESLSELPRSEVLVLAGGSQGEGPSAMRRLSQGTHPGLELEEGDTVVVSARVIPGNEKAVFTMLGDFKRRGAEVITRNMRPHVHTSGHASREELTKMIEWTKPQGFVPVHGTLHHLERHASLAEELGVRETLVVEDGRSVEVPADESIRLGESFPAGTARLAWGGEVMSSRVRRRRGEMARRGVVFVTVTVTRGRKPWGTPRLTVLGVPGVDDDPGAMAVVESAVRRGLDEAQHGRMTSIEEGVRRAVRAVIVEMASARPLVEVHVTQVEV